MMNGYDEWIWIIFIHFWMVIMNVYDSVVMNGYEWSRMAANSHMNGCKWLWMVLILWYEWLWIMYFNIFPHISTISIWYSSRLSWPPPPLFPEVQSDKLEGSVGLCWMGHLSAVAAGCLGQTKSRMILHWGFSERGFKLKPHVSWLVIWNIFYFSINWE